MDIAKVWETLPLVWLIFLCIADIKNEFTLRTFFCQTVDGIYRRMAEMRGIDQNWECPSLKNDLTVYKNHNIAYKCPVFFSLEKYKARFQDCPQIFENVDGFWVAIQKGFMRYNQAMYFEIFFIQFFIISLTTNILQIRYISAFMAVVIFLFPYFLLTYQERKPMPFFENKKKRLLFAVFIWLFVLGLSMMATPLF